MTDIEQAIIHQIARLDNVVNLLESFDSNPRNFKLEITTPNWQEFDQFVKGNELFIYIIRIQFEDKEAIINSFSTFKSQGRDEYRLSSLNKTNTFSKVLYVGTSALGVRSLKSRLRQHLGDSGKKVYSLQLAQWLLPICKEIEVEIIPVDEIHAGALYALENALWDFYTPLFGKKGVNVNTSSKM